MNNNIEIIDNYLDKEYFDSLVAFFMDDKGPQVIEWTMVRNIEGPGNPDASVKLFYMTHIFYVDIIMGLDNGKKVYGVGHISSPFFEKILPLLDKLNIKSLIRVKANLYPYSGETLHEHRMHTDYEFPHYAALLSLNTCDGYTKLEDGTKVESIANRILHFDGSQKHCSTTTTSKFARINININYL